MLRRLSILLAAVATLALAPTRAGAAPPSGWWTETTGAALAVNGTYVPIVGDFAGGSTSDIIWYAPGTGTDYLWTSDGSGGFAKAPLARQINGTYTPIVGDFAGDLRDDVFWYGPGTAADFLWIFNDGTPTSVNKAISGTYQPSVLPESDVSWGGKDKILWYAPGTGSDSIWRFTTAQGAHTSVPSSIAGSPKPLIGDFDGNGVIDIVWYNPGTATETYWRATGPNATYGATTFSVTGTYTPIVYDLTPNTDGRSDIAWYRNGSSVFNVWQGKADGTWSTDVWSTNGRGTPLLSAIDWGYIHFYDPAGADRIWYLNDAAPPYDKAAGNTEIPAGYTPIVGRFTQGTPDIFWYKAGSAPEYLFTV